MTKEDWEILKDCASKADIAQLAPVFGIDIVRCGRGWRHRDYDSLKINDNLWKRWSGKTGVLGTYAQGTTIQLVREYTGLSHKDAVLQIVQYADPALYTRIAETGRSSRQPLQSLEQRVQRARDALGQHTPAQPAQEPLQLPPKSSSSDVVIRYLTAQRALDPEIVRRELDAGRLYQDTRRNCVFVGFRKDGRPAYASLRSTDPEIPFRMDVRGSQKAHSWKVLPDAASGTLFVFESPIEAMSYMTILKDRQQDWTRSAFLSLGGIGGAALFQHLQDAPHTSEVFLCLNNDAAGHNGTARLAKVLGPDRARILLPGDTGQDWNDALRALKSGQHIRVQHALPQPAPDRRNCSAQGR